MTPVLKTAIDNAIAKTPMAAWPKFITDRAPEMVSAVLASVELAQDGWLNVAEGYTRFPVKDIDDWVSSCSAHDVLRLINAIEEITNELCDRISVCDQYDWDDRHWEMVEHRLAALREAGKIPETRPDVVERVRQYEARSRRMMDELASLGGRYPRYRINGGLNYHLVHGSSGFAFSTPRLINQDIGPRATIEFNGDNKSEGSTIADAVKKAVSGLMPAKMFARQEWSDIRKYIDVGHTFARG